MALDSEKVEEAYQLRAEGRMRRRDALPAAAPRDGGPQAPAAASRAPMLAIQVHTRST